MADVRVYLGFNDAENAVLKAFYDGCHESKALASLEDYKPSDVAVVFGVFKKGVSISIPRGRVIEKQRLRGLDTVIIETGYINRGSGPDNHYAVGLNGLNGRADFRNVGMPSDRAQQWNMKPWKESGDTIVLCGQVPWDASVDFTNHVQWVIETAAVLQNLTQREIVFRPHPLAKIPSITGCSYSVGVPIEQDLERAHAVVTFNSNSGVDAIMNGVPVFAWDHGSMVYRVANKNWGVLECPMKPDRSQWLNDISYAQWTPRELADGLAWTHLGLSNTLNQPLQAQMR